jgi:hypothetical protein
MGAGAGAARGVSTTGAVGASGITLGVTVGAGAGAASGGELGTTASVLEPCGVAASWAIETEAQPKLVMNTHKISSFNNNFMLPPHFICLMIKYQTRCLISVLLQINLKIYYFLNY